MNIGIIVSKNLKRIRHERNLSLAELSEISGVSKGMLSQIENNGTSPTINTIWKICIGLNIPYTTLLEGDNDPANTVIKKAEINKQQSPDGHYRIYGYYSDSPHHNFELFQIELDEGTSYTSVGHAKTNQKLDSEEYVMVLVGQLTLITDNKQLILNQDDAIRFDPTHQHIYQNSGSGILKAMIINFYPV